MEKESFKGDKKGYIKDIIQGVGIIGILVLIFYLIFVLAWIEIVNNFLIF